jgi:hypothetical protein
VISRAKSNLATIALVPDVALEDDHKNEWASEPWAKCEARLYALIEGGGILLHSLATGVPESRHEGAAALAGSRSDQEIVSGESSGGAQH